MEKDLILTLLFVVLFGTGISFMQYQMMNPTINILLTIIGLIGGIKFGYRICKK